MTKDVPGFTTVAEIARRKKTDRKSLHRIIAALGIVKHWLGDVAAVRDEDVKRIMDAPSLSGPRSVIPGYITVRSIESKKGVSRQRVHGLIEKRGVQKYRLGSLIAVRDEDVPLLLSSAARGAPSSRKRKTPRA